ncbi:small integral membrane protein 5 [Leptodactylus fuscus]
MSNPDIKEEIQKLGDRLLIKLKQIPQGDTVEIISLSIILVFIGVVLLMAILACCFCCCGNNKRRTVRVQPKPEV